MTKFVDTNILLANLEQLKKEKFFLLSSVTLTELEEIKTNRTKTDDIRFNARKAIHFLDDYPDHYKIVVYSSGVEYSAKTTLRDSPDVRILQCAKYAEDVMGISDLVFVSNDILAKLIAKEYFGLNVCGMDNTHDLLYLGYKSITLTENEMAYFYEHPFENTYELLINQYLILKNQKNEVVDVLKWVGNEYETVQQKAIKSNMFGTLKPLDEIQRCAMDSIISNDITVLYGRAGSGKTTLPLNYIAQRLEKGTFKKCYFIYSYEPLKGAKTLGYEKGDHITKLLQTASIGNILASKFGDLQQVEYLMERGMLEIIPTANIRGCEFSSDSCCMVTEAQNLDVYTLKTIIQRCKDGCKQIYEGDIIEQKDTNISDMGITRLIDVFKGNSKFGCIKLKNNYRGELTELADKM